MSKMYAKHLFLMAKGVSDLSPTPYVIEPEYSKGQPTPSGNSRFFCFVWHDENIY